MDFFEEDEPVDGPSPGREVGRTRRSGAPPPEGPRDVSNQQILTRRLILAGVSIVVLEFEPDSVIEELRATVKLNG